MAAPVRVSMPPAGTTYVSCQTARGLPPALRLGGARPEPATGCCRPGTSRRPTHRQFTFSDRLGGKPQRLGDLLIGEVRQVGEDSCLLMPSAPWRRPWLRRPGARAGTAFAHHCRSNGDRSYVMTESTTQGGSGRRNERKGAPRVVHLRPSWDTGAGQGGPGVSATERPRGNASVGVAATCAAHLRLPAKNRSLMPMSAGPCSECRYATLYGRAVHPFTKSSAKDPDRTGCGAV